MATPTTLPATFVAGNVLTAAQMNNLRGGFRILQVVSTVKTDPYSASVAAYTDITGLSATITPREATSQILVIANTNITMNNVSSIWMLRLMRGSTAIYLGDTAGSRTRASVAGEISGSTNIMATPSLVFLDSPATTSATTYKVQVQGGGASSTVVINRTNTDTDNSTWPRMASSITLLEVSA